MKWVRRLLLYPALVVGGCHFAVTGSPIPLWHLEGLESPALIHSAVGRNLILADGRTVELPFIKAVPRDDLLFRDVTDKGVEVGPDGELWGLVWVDRWCGNDPVAWKLVRVNLSDLAAAVRPAAVDDSLVHPETIAYIAESKRIDSSEPRHREGRVAVYDLSKLRFIREQFEAAEEEERRVWLGERLYRERGCSQCHRQDSETKVGPGFAGTFGPAHRLVDGTMTFGNDDYIRESILNPRAKVREGFQPVMPTYAGLLEDVEVDALVAFVKSRSRTPATGE